MLSFDKNKFSDFFYVFVSNEINKFAKLTLRKTNKKITFDSNFTKVTEKFKIKL